MESGEFSRGKESIRADGGIVMVGNFDVDVARRAARGHLFGPMPKEMRDDTAFNDRIHAYLPGWDVPSSIRPSSPTTSASSATSWPSAGASSDGRLASTSPRDGWTGAASSAGAIARPRTTPSTGCSSSFGRPRHGGARRRARVGRELALELRRRVKEQQAASAPPSSATSLQLPTW